MKIIYSPTLSMIVVGGSGPTASSKQMKKLFLKRDFTITSQFLRNKIKKFTETDLTNLSSRILGILSAFEQQPVNG